MRQTMKRNNFTMESTLYAKSWFVADFELKLCEFILRGARLQRYQNILKKSFNMSHKVLHTKFHRTKTSIYSKLRVIV